MVGTYEFGALLQAQEQELLAIAHVRVGMQRLHLGFVFVALRFPVDGALDLAFEVRWETRRNQRHFDVLVGVWLKLARHGLQLEVVAAHQA